MLLSDSYLTIAREVTGEYKDRGSKFIAYAFPVEDEASFKSRLTELRKIHFDAVHHCSALILGATKEFQKFSDDREPANSAGRPILRELLSKDLTYTAVIVVRYFGGKLLGVPGLINAYASATAQALQAAEITKVTVMDQYKMTVPFGMENEIYKVMKQFGLRMIDKQHHTHFSVIFEVRHAEAAQVLHQLEKHHVIHVEPHATTSEK